MSNQASSETDHEFDFTAIEAAVRETERGRWFLTEFDRRGRIAETQSLLAAIRKLEDIVAVGSAGVSPPALSPNIGAIIAQARAEISATRAQMLPDDRTQTANCDVFAALTIDAKILAVELAHLAEVLQAADASELPHLSGRLSTLAKSHDALTCQIAAVSSLLLSLDRAIDDAPADETPSVATRLETLLTGAPRPAGAILSEDNLRYFGKDEELFGALEPLLSSSPASGLTDLPTEGRSPDQSSGKNRIVIVRTSTTDARPIPLADEPPTELTQPAA